MTKWYSLFRWGGYLCGAAGLALVLISRRMSPPSAALQAAGGFLLLAMFLCFVITQLLYILYRLKRKKGADRPRDA
ncbi:MAG: hypothetical protein PHD86_03600 [Kiritimatiellae bacterium]|nr:hypothetical protein [Kiritimatiellia bacterium]